MSIKKKTSLPWVIAATVVFIAMMIIVRGSGLGNAKLTEIGGGSGMIDLEYGYTAEKAYSMIEDYGAEGRTFYLRRVIPADIVFGLSYLLCFTLLIRYLLQSLDVRPKARTLYALPVLMLAFDWAENSCVAVMLRKFPETLTGLCAVSNWMTIWKFVFTLGTAVVILTLGAMAAVRHFKKKA